MADIWSKLSGRINAARTRTDVVDEHGFRASRNIKELLKLSAAIEAMIDAEIIRGHDQGASWAMLGYSKQHAYGRYKRAVATRDEDLKRKEPFTVGRRTRRSAPPQD